MDWNFPYIFMRRIQRPCYSLPHKHLSGVTVVSTLDHQPSNWLDREGCGKESVIKTEHKYVLVKDSLSGRRKSVWTINNRRKYIGSDHPRLLFLSLLSRGQESLDSSTTVTQVPCVPVLLRMSHQPFIKLLVTLLRWPGVFLSVPSETLFASSMAWAFCFKNVTGSFSPSLSEMILSTFVHFVFELRWVVTSPFDPS